MYIGSIKDSNGVVHTSYDKYLASKHWQEKKARYQKIYVKNCVVCGKDDRLHLHHMTYARIGNERLDDLCYLCDKCHSYVHSGVEEVPSRAVLDTFKKSYMRKNQKANQGPKLTKEEKKIARREKRKQQKEENKKAAQLRKHKDKEASVVFKRKNNEEKSIVNTNKKIDNKIKNTTFEKLSSLFQTNFNEEILNLCTDRFKVIGSGKYKIKCLDKENKIVCVKSIRTSNIIKLKIISS